jgi:CheY-like chemotaxis protein
MDCTAVVVDDDAASAATVARLLARAGCRCVVCTDAERAVALTLSSDVDLIFLDLSMPGLDGYQVLALLRSHELTRRAPSLPVIAVTGRAGFDDRAASLAAGFTAHLVKPVRLDDLERALRVALTLRRTLHRARYSVDQADIEHRLRAMNLQDGADRLQVIAGLALAVEQQGTAILQQALQRAYAGDAQAVAAALQPLAALATRSGAAKLGALCRDLAAEATAGPEAFELAAALLRAELDRVLYTLRERVLG